MKVRHVNYSPDEFLVGIAGLEAQEIGVYWVVCSLIYSIGGPVADDDERLLRFCGCHRRTLRSVLDRLERAGKIVSTDGQLMVNRCATELERARKRSAQGAEDGPKGGRPRKEISRLSKADPFQDENLTTNQEPVTTNQEPKGAPPAPAGKYAFEGKIIRLNQADFDRWAKMCPHLDLASELMNRDDYLANRAPEALKKEWFISTSNWLIGKERDRSRPELKGEPEVRPGMSAERHRRRAENAARAGLPLWVAYGDEPLPDGKTPADRTAARLAFCRGDETEMRRRFTDEPKSAADTAAANA